MDWLGLLQWPAMAVTVAAWLAGSRRRYRRGIGCGCFLLSNPLWTVWGLYAAAAL